VSLKAQTSPAEEASLPAEAFSAWLGERAISSSGDRSATAL
jgi:hypothetical protein